MKKILLLSILSISLSVVAERIEPIPYGDMEQWVVRYIEESKLLGGKTKTLYCLAPTDRLPPFQKFRQLYYTIFR